MSPRRRPGRTHPPTVGRAKYVSIPCRTRHLHAASRRYWWSPFPPRIRTATRGTRTDSRQDAARWPLSRSMPLRPCPAGGAPSRSPLSRALIPIRQLSVSGRGITPHHEQETRHGHHNPDQPVAEVRLGRITATIWRNRTAADDGVFYSTQLTRLYRRDEKWERAHAFGRDDLLTVRRSLIWRTRASTNSRPRPRDRRRRRRGPSRPRPGRLRRHTPRGRSTPAARRFFCTPPPHAPARAVRLEQSGHEPGQPHDAHQGPRADTAADRADYEPLPQLPALDQLTPPARADRAPPAHDQIFHASPRSLEAGGDLAGDPGPRDHDVPQHGVLVVLRARSRATAAPSAPLNNYHHDDRQGDDGRAAGKGEHGPHAD